MSCPKCNYDGDTVMMDESLSCKDCDCQNKMTYHLCPGCKSMWREFNGIVVEGSYSDFGEMVEGAGFVEVVQDQESFFSGLKEELMKETRAAAGEATMSDFIHKCLHCNNIALPSSDSSYRCTACGFEWEIKALG